MGGSGAPLTPPGWEEAAGRLVRLADAGGRAVAWVAPEFGANCVGYAVRRGDGWAQVLHAAGPGALGEAPTRYGFPLLFPFPGHMRGARYRWAGVEYALPPNVPGQQRYVHGFAAFLPWRVAGVEADSMVAEFATRTDLPDWADSGYPFDVRLRLTVRLVGGALAVAFEATNAGAAAAPVGLGMHPYFACAALGGDRAAVRVSLPGRSELVLDDAIPTGARRAVVAREVVPPPLGATAVLVRTDLGVGASAVLQGSPGTGRVTLQLDEGCRTVVFFAPPAQSSLSVEPQSVAPGAASQPEGHPDGLVGLAPGATTRLAVTVVVGKA